MPSRIIRDSCRTSPNLDALSDAAERMFWRLTTVADDFGRFESDPRVLLSSCFPLRVDRVKPTQVKKWLEEMVSCDLVTTYVVNGRHYAFFNTWEKHQRTRAKESKYPSPTSDNICGHPPRNAPVFGGKESKVRNVSDNTSPPPQPTDGGVPDLSVNGWGTPEALKALYNELTPDELPEVTKLSPARIAKAKKYLAMFPDRGWWVQTFEQIQASLFLRGLKPSKGHEHFKANFDWLLSKGKDGTENALKVNEGHYLGES